MHRNQHHSQNLESVTVPPGNETGWYYIVVANLSYSTTWKDLKAFAEQACEVDHAEVYPPTGGFVRVRGLANFEKAFKHLDGNTLEYRALQADDRNRTEPTVVKLARTDYHYHTAKAYRAESRSIPNGLHPLFPCPNAQLEVPPRGPGAGASSPYSNQYGSAAPTLSMAPQLSTQWNCAAPPSFSSTEAHQAPSTSAALALPGPVPYQTAPDPSIGFSYQAVASAHPSFPQPAGYQGAVVPTSGVAHSPIGPFPYGTTSGPCYSPQIEYGIEGQNFKGYFDFQASSPPPGCSPGYAVVWPPEAVPVSIPFEGQIVNYGNAAPGVVVEQRKIFIRNLKRDGLGEAAVVNLIAEHAGIGLAAGEIERIELPINNNGRARGTAFVTFGAAELASAAISVLDGRDVAGKKLDVRLAQEGVSRSAGYSSRPGRRRGAPAGGGTSRKPDPTQEVVKASGTTGAGWVRELAAALPPSPAPPAVSPWGSASPSGSASQKGGGKDGVPVVVDGSGCRRKKEQPPVVVDGRAGKGAVQGNDRRGSRA
ncbi:hypothetical protein VTK26DRAFT_759 [Humicola hyalothermophila]